jgi:predicted ATPase/Tfp pilus assembly protein PilF
MAYQVFVSHSSKDKAVADALCRALEDQGIRCWIAPRDILPGQDWSEAIINGLNETAVTVLIFSESSGASIQVRREVERSFEKGKEVVPFRIDDVIPTGAFDYYLSSVHWLNASPPYEAHFDALVETVKRHLPASSPDPAASPVSASPTAAPVPAAIAYDNLPAPQTPYIGREKELSEWETLLGDPAVRLLTLVGFGGMGKTRSALELGARCVARFSGGACWAELDTAVTEEEMLQRIVSALSLTLQPQPSARDQLISFLQGKEMLLILDNTEQIEDAGRAVNEFMKRLPSIKWLVTSRKALELPAERIAEIPPLPPEKAEELFIERAQARQPGFERTEENAGDIEELCRRLEGMPLAIELAAARIVGMTPREMVQRLDDQFRLLQSRASHLPPRQRAMQGAIEWSHNLLTEEDKDLFAQVSVFANGFTLEGAEAICDAFDVFEGVHELRRHSLLRSESRAATQQMRFFMLEMVRSYASRRLEKEEVRERHARFFLEFANDRNRKLRTREESRVLKELEAELDNLRSAFRWSRDGRETELCAELALALFQPLYYRGFWKELRETLLGGLEASEGLSGEKALLRIELGRQIASIDQDMGDLPAARARAEATLALYEERGDSAGVAETLNLLGLIATDEKEIDSAERLFRRALEAFGEENAPGRAKALHNLGRLAARRDDLDAAQRLYEESLTHRRAAGDARGEAETLGNLGVIAFSRKESDEARRLYQQSLSLRKTLEDRFGVALMLYNLAEISEREGGKALPLAFYAHSERIFAAYPSAYAAAPAEALERLAEAMGPRPYAQARAHALKRSWEEIVDLALQTDNKE